MYMLVSPISPVGATDPVARALTAYETDTAGDRVDRPYKDP